MANSQHPSPLPPPQAPAPLQDLFYNSMMMQPPWMQQNSPDFGMMGADHFPAGFLGELTLGMVGVADKSLWGAPSAPNAHLPSQTTFNFPSSSGQSMMPRGCSLDPAGQRSPGVTAGIFWAEFSVHVLYHPLYQLQMSFHPPHSRRVVLVPNTLQPAPLMLLLPLTRDPSLMLDAGYYNTPMTSHNRFPEESEPITHQGEHVVTGRRSDDMNAALEVGFGDIECGFLELSTSTTLPMNQLINLFLKTRGRTVNGTNYWNLYANYFKDHGQQELARISKQVPDSGGTAKHEEASLFGSSPQTIAQRAQAFQKHYRIMLHPYPVVEEAFPDIDDHRSAVIASQKPVIEGEAPPPEWLHAGARRMFINGNTDYDGLPRIKFSAATTKVRKDEPAGTSMLKPLPRAMAQKPNSNMRLEVVPPPSRPFKVVPRPIATPRDVIELTSAKENLLEEPGTEYEETEHGKKRKIKLNIIKQCAFEMDLLRNPRKNVLNHCPVTKGTGVVMNCGLRMVYGNSDSESEVNSSKTMDPATGMGSTIPEGSGTTADVQADVSEEDSAQVTEQEALVPATLLNAVAPTIPNQQPLSDVPHAHNTSNDNNAPREDPLYDSRDLHHDDDICGILLSMILVTLHTAILARVYTGSVMDLLALVQKLSWVLIMTAHLFQDFTITMVPLSVIVPIQANIVLLSTQAIHMKVDTPDAMTLKSAGIHYPPITIVRLVGAIIALNRDLPNPLRPPPAS
ncbi:hypothetical protein DFJ58DRAFT_840341 [Suillus subalutaceus]|uniref:uncharacterized protein n=1 Tax=Suillus subalutaceus TaxID=48586 RepID=UPI001B86B30C|nr:uncharacterized protein DFJ58DRAFT_840341 [Suillus subalutaceus]KAG1858748.1 hypothetical protein DFJ58DRAFT_840341 [Suillus subalutaceus]